MDCILQDTITGSYTRKLVGPHAFPSYATCLHCINQDYSNPLTPFVARLSCSIHLTLCQFATSLHPLPSIPILLCRPTCTFSLSPPLPPPPPYLSTRLCPPPPPPPPLPPLFSHDPNSSTIQSISQLSNGASYHCQIL